MVRRRWQTSLVVAPPLLMQRNSLPPWLRGFVPAQIDCQIKNFVVVNQLQRAIPHRREEIKTPGYHYQASISRAPKCRRPGAYVDGKDSKCLYSTMPREWVINKSSLNQVFVHTWPSEQELAHTRPSGQLGARPHCQPRALEFMCRAPLKAFFLGLLDPNRVLSWAPDLVAMYTGKQGLNIRPYKACPCIVPFHVSKKTYKQLYLVVFYQLWFLPSPLL